MNKTLLKDMSKKEILSYIFKIKLKCSKKLNIPVFDLKIEAIHQNKSIEEICVLLKTNDRLIFVKEIIISIFGEQDTDIIISSIKTCHNFIEETEDYLIFKNIKFNILPKHLVQFKEDFLKLTSTDCEKVGSGYIANNFFLENYSIENQKLYSTLRNIEILDNPPLKHHLYTIDENYHFDINLLTSKNILILDNVDSLSKFYEHFKINE